GQEVWRNRRDGSDYEPSLFGSRYFLDFQLGGVDLVQDSFGTRQERFAHLREAHDASEPVKQSGSEFLLQLAYLLRERRLREVFVLGGPRKVACPGHRTKITELMKLHCLVQGRLRVGVIPQRFFP